MAKNFPFFKFVATEWLTGDIVYESFELQGLFINICALYWQRDGKLTISDIEMRYKNTELIAKLTDRFFSVTDGFISIAFLDEQLIEAHHISKKNSENGKLGGRPKVLKTLDKKPTALRPLSDIKAKKSKEEQEEEQEEEIKKNNINERKHSFAETIKPFIDYYGRDLCLKFYEYWTEPNKSKTKLKFEMQKTWDISKRLKRWADNNFDTKPKQNNTLPQYFAS